MILYAKVSEPNNGHAHDKVNVQALNAEHYYVVSGVDMGGSYTTIYLESDKTDYNSVNFTFYSIVDGKFEVYNIFSDPQYNPYLSL